MYKFPNKVLFSEHISGSKHSIEILTVSETELYPETELAARF